MQGPGSGQPGMVQQVQLLQQKPDQQMVQIPPQALKVVQAASATLPPVPQRQTAPSHQMATAEPTQVSTSICRLLSCVRKWVQMTLQGLKK